MFKGLFNKKNEDAQNNKGFGVLSDRDIKSHLNELFTTPVWDDCIQPASVDLHLSNILKDLDGDSFDLNKDDYLLCPDEFLLGSTKEYVTIPCDIVAMVDGKSSLARLGVAVHITAGWIDPGYNGNITLEIKNNSNKSFRLSEDMLIGQIVFLTLTSPVKRLYGDESLNNHYQGSNGTVLSQYCDEREDCD